MNADKLKQYRDVVAKAHSDYMAVLDGEIRTAAKSAIKGRGKIEAGATVLCKTSCNERAWVVALHNRKSKPFATVCWANSDDHSICQVSDLTLVESAVLEPGDYVQHEDGHRGIFVNTTAVRWDDECKTDWEHYDKFSGVITILMKGAAK